MNNTRFKSNIFRKMRLFLYLIILSALVSCHAERKMSDVSVESSAMRADIKATSASSEDFIRDFMSLWRADSLRIIMRVDSAVTSAGDKLYGPMLCVDASRPQALVTDCVGINLKDSGAMAIARIDSMSNTLVKDSVGSTTAISRPINTPWYWILCALSVIGVAVWLKTRKR